MQKSVINKKNDIYSNNLELYFQDVKRYRRLTNEETIELFKQYEKGSMKAKELLINHNLRLAAKIANKHYKYGDNYMDLIQESNFGLIRAVEKFDYKKGYMFSTYAVHQMHFMVKRYLQNNVRTIRLPVHLENSLYSILQKKEEIEKETSKEANLEDIAIQLDIDVDKVEMLIKNHNSIISYETEFFEDKSHIHYLKDEAIPDPLNYVLDKDVSKLVDDFVSKLPYKYGVIFKYRVFNDYYQVKPKTLKELGMELKITGERVRQLENKLLNILKELLVKNDYIESDNVKLCSK